MMRSYTSWAGSLTAARGRAVAVAAHASLAGQTPLVSSSRAIASHPPTDASRSPTPAAIHQHEHREGHVSTGHAFGHTRVLRSQSPRAAASAASLALGIAKTTSRTRVGLKTQKRPSLTTMPKATRVAAAPKVITPPQGTHRELEDDAEDDIDTTMNSFEDTEEGALLLNNMASPHTTEMDEEVLEGVSARRQQATDRKGAPLKPVKVAPTLSSTTPAPTTLLNPFKGLHAHISRSYRLDQLASVASADDILLARQEQKSSAFSFLRFASGSSFYQDHWSSVPELCDAYAQHDLFNAQMRPGRAGRTGASGIAVPGYTLFNNRLGLDDRRVETSFPLLVAQRLLLFSDSYRHFHALCGRENVPCDFFADIDLPDARTPAEGEKTLLEVLNYLEVRLPGVGFTDPFFMVLANEHMQSGRSSKIGYHIHARSMTFAQERALLSVADASTSLKRSVATESAGASLAARAAGDAHGADGLDAEDDDLTDLVNVVDGSGATAKGTSTSSSSASAGTRIIAFQDYRAVKLLADEVNQTVGRTVIDEACYRANGMLRCAFSGKLQSKQDGPAFGAVSSAALGGLLVPLTQAKDKALQKKLSATEEVLRTLTDPEILELSFCTRHLDTVETAKKLQQHLKSVLPPARSVTKRERLLHDDLLKAATRHRFKLVRPRHVLGPQSAQSAEYDMYGNIVSPFLTEGAKWRRYKSVVAKLHDLPSNCATSYDIWVRIGLALHNFSNEDHVFEEWVKFSLRCPQKYSRESCRRKWVQFERNPDAQNWRRGFNYLNSTIWRNI